MTSAIRLYETLGFRRHETASLVLSDVRVYAYVLRV